MKRNFRKNPFTLIELLVSMGLLTLLVMLMLQLFGGAQRLWIASDRRNNVYADARVAMDLMADLLNAVQFSHGEKLEQVTDDTTGRKLTEVKRDKTLDTVFFSDGSQLLCAVSTDREFKHTSSKNYFVAFKRGSNDGKLYLTVCSDSGSAATPAGDNFDDKFYGFFPPYGLDGGPVNRDGAFDSLKGELQLETTSAENDYCQIIAENVVDLTFTAYKLDDNGALQKVPASSSSPIIEPPYLLEIRLTMLDKDDYERYNNISDDTSKKDFLDQHRHTFARSVFLGNRWSLEAQTSGGD